LRVLAWGGKDKGDIVPEPKTGYTSLEELFNSLREGDTFTLTLDETEGEKVYPQVGYYPERGEVVINTSDVWEVDWVRTPCQLTLVTKEEEIELGQTNVDGRTYLPWEVLRDKTREDTRLKFTQILPAEST
jgi:hypothetical protein